MKILQKLGISVLALFALAGLASAQKWQRLKQQGGFTSGPGVMLLLTDGTVLVQDAESPRWFKLTPDIHGSYVNGTWKQVASTPSNYGPLWFGSVVLPDGRVGIEGGEYNLKGPGVWTNLGAIYDPIKNKWTPVNPPSGWTTIGDAQSVILDEGTYMQANCCTKQSALFDPAKLTWTPTGSGKFDVNDEEGWTKLPNGKVLTVDAYVFTNATSGTNSELYDPKTGKWARAGSTVKQLWDSCPDEQGQASHEVGPAVLRPDGTVFATGSNGCGAGHTAIYDSKTGKWKAGPDFPVVNGNTLSITDGPAALEINGNVVMMTSPGLFNNGAVFFEWNGSKLTQIPGAPNAPSDTSYFGKFLELPTGQLLFNDFATVSVFNPKGTYQKAWAPTITSVPSSVTRGKTYLIKGKQFNGLSQGAAYGDDLQSATNYALVRITNNVTKHVFYARTVNPSTMAIATGSLPVSTHFTVSASTETGASTLVVVTNGIPSVPKAVTVN
jgi:hypothetical protein